MSTTHKSSRNCSFCPWSIFSPTLLTLQQALAKNYIDNFPGLMEQTLHQHPPQSIAMVKGHLDWSWQNQRSTKPKVTVQDTTTNNEHDTSEDYWPPSQHNNNKTHHCFAACTKDSTTGKIFTNQTRCFILPSSTGNTQLFILYHYDSNSIHAEPIKTNLHQKFSKPSKLCNNSSSKQASNPNFNALIMNAPPYLLNTWQPKELISS